MKRSPLLRKTPLDGRPKTPKPKRDPWIPPRKRPDLSRMDCCPEAVARAEALVSGPCIACGLRGTRRDRDFPPRPMDLVIHHLRDGQGMQERAPWWETLGLHERCHAAAGKFSIHGGQRREFAAKYGTERELLERVNARLPPELWGPGRKRNNCLLSVG